MVVTHNGGRKADDSDDLINLILTQFDFSVSLSMLHGIWRGLRWFICIWTHPVGVLSCAWVWQWV